MRGAALCVLACLAGAPAYAADQPAMVVFGAGVFDLFGDTKRAGDLRLAVRLPSAGLNVTPFFGLEGTTDGGFLALTGMAADFEVQPNLFIGGTGGLGYFRAGSGADLGHELEFRATVEVTWRLPGGNRVGVALGHISNFWRGQTNPGAETLGLIYLVPLEP